MTAAERKRRQREREAMGEGFTPEPCGTYAAARRHLRKDEPLCAACEVALKNYQAETYQRRVQRNNS